MTDKELFFNNGYEARLKGEREPLEGMADRYYVFGYNVAFTIERYNLRAVGIDIAADDIKKEIKDNRICIENIKSAFIEKADKSLYRKIVEV